MHRIHPVVVEVRAEKSDIVPGHRVSCLRPRPPAETVVGPRPLAPEPNVFEAQSLERVRLEPVETVGVPQREDDHPAAVGQGSQPRVRVPPEVDPRFQNPDQVHEPGQPLDLVAVDGAKKEDHRSLAIVVIGVPRGLPCGDGGIEVRPTTFVQRLAIGHGPEWVTPRGRRHLSDGSTVDLVQVRVEPVEIADPEVRERTVRNAVKCRVVSHRSSVQHGRAFLSSRDMVFHPAAAPVANSPRVSDAAERTIDVRRRRREAGSMQADRHAGRSVVVTGGSSGIGRGIALRFAEEGADVAVADVRRDPKQGEYFETDVETPTDAAIRERTGSDAIYVETDVSDPDAAATLVEETADAFGAVDVLVNNAGIYIPGDSQDLTPEEWHEVLGVDLDGTFFASKAAIPHLRDRSGAIVNIGSVHATEGGAGPAYPSAKAAVVNLTRDLAVELGNDAVNVNCICPGFVKTAVQDYHTEESLRREMEERTLLPGVADPEDIGDVAVWLASDEASFVHGETIYADGGWTAHRG